MSQWVSQSVTRSPIELFWTAKNQMHNFGKGTIDTNRSNHGGIIKANSLATSSRPVKGRSGKVVIEDKLS